MALMKQDPPLPVHWFWQSEEEFIHELSSKLPQALDYPTELYIRGKILAFLSGNARNRKDFKELVAFRDQGLIELRFTLFIESSEIRVRLILAKVADRITFLQWHVKDSEQTLEKQRAGQNLDCLEAIERLKGMTIDNTNPSR